MQLLGGDQRKAVGQVEAHLVAEDGERAGAGPVILAMAVVAHLPHEVEILFHGAEKLADSGPEGEPAACPNPPFPFRPRAPIFGGLAARQDYGDKR